MEQKRELLDKIMEKINSDEAKFDIDMVDPATGDTNTITFTKIS